MRGNGEFFLVETSAVDHDERNLFQFFSVQRERNRFCGVRRDREAPCSREPGDSSLHRTRFGRHIAELHGNVFRPVPHGFRRTENPVRGLHPEIDSFQFLLQFGTEQIDRFFRKADRFSVQRISEKITRHDSGGEVE